MIDAEQLQSIVKSVMKKEGGIIARKPIPHKPPPRLEEVEAKLKQKLKNKKGADQRSATSRGASRSKTSERRASTSLGGAKNKFNWYCPFRDDVVIESANKPKVLKHLKEAHEQEYKGMDKQEKKEFQERIYTEFQNDKTFDPKTVDRKLAEISSSLFPPEQPSTSSTSKVGIRGMPPEEKQPLSQPPQSIQVNIPKSKRGKLAKRVQMTKATFANITSNPKQAWRVVLRDFFTEMGISSLNELPPSFIQSFNALYQATDKKDDEMAKVMAEQLVPQFRQELGRLKHPEKSAQELLKETPQIKPKPRRKAVPKAKILKAKPDLAVQDYHKPVAKKPKPKKGKKVKPHGILKDGKTGEQIGGRKINKKAVELIV